MSIEPNQISKLADWIIDRKVNLSEKKNLIVAVSGIDASGKGYVCKRLTQELLNRNKTIFLENLDGWLNLPSVRFGVQNPAEHFYYNAFRWQELKDNILIPYSQQQNIDCEVSHIEETWQNFQTRKVKIENCEMLIIEGIFLLQSQLLPLFDLKIWIDCSFETALERALSRNQEGLSSPETIEAYQTIFFPAQKLHFHLDNPQSHADLIFENN